MDSFARVYVIHRDISDTFYEYSPTWEFIEIGKIGRLTRQKYMVKENANFHQRVLIGFYFSRKLVWPLIFVQHKLQVLWRVCGVYVQNQNKITKNKVQNRKEIIKKKLIYRPICTVRPASVFSFFYLVDIVIKWWVLHLHNNYKLHPKLAQVWTSLINSSNNNNNLYISHIWNKTTTQQIQIGFWIGILDYGVENCWLKKSSELIDQWC